jgi:hypothetical protein
MQTTAHAVGEEGKVERAPKGRKRGTKGNNVKGRAKVG